MSNKKIPVTLLTGYLGAGKTTLLNYVLGNQKGYKVAVIVNDIGEVNIDASLIENNGVVNQKDDNLVPLSNGCICCTLKTDLMNQLIELAESGKFNYILIEASGICEPLPIAQSITALEDESNPDFPHVVRLDNIVTVVDAKRMYDEFMNGEALHKENLDDDDIENLLIQQIEFCNTIVLNKVDMISEKDKLQVEAVIRSLQKEAKIIECNYGHVELDEIFDTHNFDFEKVGMSAEWIKALNEEEEEKPEGEALEYGISTFVYEARKPFDRVLFEEFVSSDWPTSIIRSKGLCWFSTERDMAFIFEQSGKQKTLGEMGRWIASAPKKKQEELLKDNPDAAKNWDEVYGDREERIVFIGHNMDKEAIIKALDKCLTK
jgi:G3E family GTPase